MSDDCLTSGSKEIVALRKLIYRLGEVGEDEEPSIFEAVDRAIERVERVEQENEDLRERIEFAEQRANSALGVAKATDTGVRADGGPSKKERAKLTARNELVKRALLDENGSLGSALTVGDVQTMLRPGTDAAYQTVKDAFTSLAAEWSAFRIAENEHGDRALRLNRDELTEDLVGAVEVDLGRDDLTKRLISRREKEAA